MLVVLALVACDEEPAPLRSPDGQWVLTPKINDSRSDPTSYRCLRIEIRDASGKVVFSEQTHASVRMKWNARWLGSNRFEIDSSDVGTLRWRRRADGGWRRERR